MNELEDFIMRRPPTAERPLLGLTVLVVEDSRFTCEALRLMCLRSGARLRRADSLGSARKHLRVYRPSVAIVDLGLPDGSGADLIATLSAATPRVPVILGTSGDTGGRDATLNAGADGFLAKPLGALGEFHEAILSKLPAEARPSGPRPVIGDHVAPDEIALRDDLAHAANLLQSPLPRLPVTYAVQFLASIARAAGDYTLLEAAEELGEHHGAGSDVGPSINRISAMIEARLAQTAVV
ncbi:MAG: response regulator [Pseudomonadota bacterium]